MPVPPGDEPAQAGSGSRIEPGTGLVIPPAASIRSVRVALLGTVAFGVAFLVLLPFAGRLGDDGHRIWLWTCLAGFIEGLFGLTLTRRHRRAGRTN
jgi:Na+-transporting NADH:ubiquinone oxidoreductase subunit NqrB